MKKNNKSINIFKAILGISALCVMTLPASAAPDFGNVNVSAGIAGRLPQIRAKT